MLVSWKTVITLFLQANSMFMIKIPNKFIQLCSLTVLTSTVYGQIESDFPTLEYYDIQKLNISLPYIKYYSIDSSLLVFGSNHTTNFQDPQVRQIYNLINSYKPTIVLYEGDGISTGKSQKETVETYFEIGLAKYLADSLSIRAINIEPNTKDKYRFLLEKYTTDDILIATLGLQITMMQINNDNFEHLFPIMIADLVKEGLPLNATQQSLDYFYKLYEKKLGKSFSYDSFDSREIQAKYTGTIFNDINRIANQFRDQHIIRLTKKYIDMRERVFLIEGGWHAIVCEPAFNLIVK